MQILDGRQVANQIQDHIKQQIHAKVLQGHPPPSLSVLLIGKLTASTVYVRQKIKACREVGIHSEVLELPANVSSDQLKKVINHCNQRADVHGILVQLPLPESFVWQEVISWIDPLKDVDSLTAENQGLAWAGIPRVLPCTPAGIMKLLNHYRIPLQGRHAVIVGRSHIVGIPIAGLLLKANATVTICHSHTQQLSDKTRAADVVIVAAGRPGLLGKNDFKSSAVVIDVGIHRIKDNGSVKLIGDVRAEELSTTEGFITPVPGGVGPMTVAMLLANTFQLAYKEPV